MNVEICSISAPVPPYQLKRLKKRACTKSVRGTNPDPATKLGLMPSISK